MTPPIFPPIPLPKPQEEGPTGASIRGGGNSKPSGKGGSKGPGSVTHPGVTTAGGLVILLGGLLLIKTYPLFSENLLRSALFILFSLGGSQLLLDFFWQKVHLRPSTGLSFQTKNPSLERALTKVIGLTGSLGFLAFLYWIFPEYHRDFYNNYWLCLRWILWPWYLAAPFYFYFVDQHMTQPRDGFWQLGQVLLFDFTEVDFGILKQHLLGWVVKGFFFPLMFTYFCNDIQSFLKTDFSSIDFRRDWFLHIHDFLFLIDVTVASVGYLFTLRLFDTHTRSTEPTIMGWVVALCCYEPFWFAVRKSYFAYDSSYTWGVWLQNSPLLYVLWGTIIILLTGFYAWATLVFGCRFSNLTYRGILTNGPYRFTKHPAYIAKNLSWWMISLPFLTQEGPLIGLQKSFCLLLLNLIYFFRAKTEEAHLRQDPIYQEYDLWIQKKGWFRWIP